MRYMSSSWHHSLGTPLARNHHLFGGSGAAGHGEQLWILSDTMDTHMNH